MANTGITLLAGTLVVLAACGGGDKGAASDTSGTASTPPAAEPAPPAAATDTGSAMAPAADTATAKTQDTAKKTSAAKPAGKAAGGGGSAAQVAEGDKIFHGQDAKGTAIAPNLTDSEWLNGDGSLAFIEHTVTTGVPKPKSHPAPMPPMGGASLNPDQIKAVAAYVYSLSHKS